MERLDIAPGVFFDDNRLIVDVPAFLRAHGWPDTPDNREKVIASGRMIAERMGLGPARTASYEEYEAEKHG